tara:strand:- start:13 stop:192 length:180 start_codon:yes stop_codon:yes gene_type:complete
MLVIQFQYQISMLWQIPQGIFGQALVMLDKSYQSGVIQAAVVISSGVLAVFYFLLSTPV